MEELIKEAESLYWQIDKVIWNLIAARENKDDEGKKKAISDMETAMCGTQQFLKCILERKDNIVDLGEVWHDISVEPRYDNKRLVFENKDGFITYCSNKSKALKIWNTWKNLPLGASIRWAYVEDLLPKGDNK